MELIRAIILLSKIFIASSKSCSPCENNYCTIEDCHVSSNLLTQAEEYQMVLIRKLNFETVPHTFFDNVMILRLTFLFVKTSAPIPENLFANINRLDVLAIKHSDELYNMMWTNVRFMEPLADKLVTLVLTDHLPPGSNVKMFENFIRLETVIIKKQLETMAFLKYMKVVKNLEFKSCSHALGQIQLSNLHNSVEKIKIISTTGLNLSSTFFQLFKNLKEISIINCNGTIGNEYNLDTLMKFQVQHSKDIARQLVALKNKLLIEQSVRGEGGMTTFNLQVEESDVDPGQEHENVFYNDVALADGRLSERSLLDPGESDLDLDLEYDTDISSNLEEELITGKKVSPKILFFTVETTSSNQLIAKCGSLGDPAVDVVLIFPDERSKIYRRTHMSFIYVARHVENFVHMKNVTGVYQCFAFNSFGTTNFEKVHFAEVIKIRSKVTSILPPTLILTVCSVLVSANAFFNKFVSDG
ncbi:hypothetical protein HELRODRAFT_178090 [Helobdella robusta]|uniref:Ig-like domain-containing protein n=1 Tax=Helobdella robusta TaxID=6412 RepID=T1FCQ1_HELRO|nr:hypothetical protein HELRODRAFT_178090 [Helobdella robusta]ESN97306.1 hypothetical protein HELRODRAFT_178090 [Helobdella robusta]